MAFITSTVQQLYDSALSIIESKINQTTPAADKAYNKVQSAVLSLLLTSLLKLATDRAKEALTISASIVGLRIIGNGYGIIEKEAQSAVIIFDVPAVEGTIIDTSVIYVGKDNGVRYRPNFQVIAGPTNIATITATALTAGVVGNLIIDQVVNADRQVPGAEQTGVVTGYVTTGTNAEEVEAYRQRLLTYEKSRGGGSNSTDYRNNAQETSGVFRADPYSGNPTYLQTGAGAIYPGERTVFIEADTSIDPDGVAPSSLLDDARSYIQYDPDTGNAREVLGCDGNSTLWVESIFNTVFYVDIFGLDISPDIEAQVKSEIEAGVKKYFRSVRPYISGLDFIADKNDNVKPPAISRVIQDIVNAYGGAFLSVTFKTTGFPLPGYLLIPGERLKLADIGGITYG